MVGRWGMSDAIGPVSVLPGPQDEPTLFPGTARAPSEATRELVDAEVRRIVDECYEAALEQLAGQPRPARALAEALLERETLDEADAYRAAGFGTPRSRARATAGCRTRAGSGRGE